MSKVRVKIKDYEIIRDMDFEVEGLTGIVGESNHGKSAICRALQTVVYNKGGKDFIRQGASKTVVGLKFEGFDSRADMSLLWDKGKEGARYKYKGELYQKTGVEVPGILAEDLNMDSLDLDVDKYFLNFMNQLEPPLLRAVSDIKMYNIIIKSLDGDKLNDAIKLAKKDITDLQDRKRAKEIELSVHQKNKLLMNSKLEVYAVLEDMRSQYKNYLSNVDRVVIGSSLLDSLSSVVGDLGVVNDKLGVVSGVDEIAGRIESVVKLRGKGERLWGLHSGLVEVLEGLSLVNSRLGIYSDLDLDELGSKLHSSRVKRDKLSRYKGLLSDYVSIRESVLKIDSKRGGLSWVDDYVSKFSKIGSIKMKRDRLELLLEKCESLGSKIEFNSKVLGSAREELGSFENTDGICPVCKSEVREEDMDLDLISEKVNKLKKVVDSLEGEKKVLNSQLEKVEGEIKDAGFSTDSIKEEISRIEVEVGKFEKEIEPVLDKIDVALEEIGNE